MARVLMVVKKIWKKVLASTEHPTIRRGVFFATAALFCLAVGFWIGFIWLNTQRASRPLPAGLQVLAAHNTATSTTIRALDGLPTPHDAFAPLMAVVIDNHPDALPQSGLLRAGVVFEVPVEGGMSRLLAFIPADAAGGRLGPVRSLRPYMLDISQAFNAWIMHVGGSPDALARAQMQGARAVNEFYRGQYFFRETSRKRPHNVFTSRDLFHQYLSDTYREGPQPFTPWIFAPEVPWEERGEGGDILVNFGAVNVKWVYDKEKNVYTRLHNGVILREADGTPVTAKNIIVQTVAGRVLDELGRLRLVLTGSGEASVFTNGRAIPGKWKREKTDMQFTYMDGQSNEVALTAGATWIEIVPSYE